MIIVTVGGRFEAMFVTVEGADKLTAELFTAIKEAAQIENEGVTMSDGRNYFRTNWMLSSPTRFKPAW